MPKLLGCASQGMNSHLAGIAERHGSGIRGHYIGLVKLPLCNRLGKARVNQRFGAQSQAVGIEENHLQKEIRNDIRNIFQGVAQFNLAGESQIIRIS